MRALLGQSYYLRFDPKLWAAMRPYPPLGTLYAASVLREGGHDVPESEIVRRWPAPWRNLLETWNAIDEIEVIDSSGPAPRRVVSKQGTLVQIRGALPKWAAGFAERADA